MFFEPVTLPEVVKNLRSGAAVGHDCTCISVVKDCVDVVCDPFTKIINRALLSGVVPTKMKIARVIATRTDTKNRLDPPRQFQTNIASG